MKNRIMGIWKRTEQRITWGGKESVLRAAGLLAGALVWWCVLYPELCFPQDTYEAAGGMEEENFQRLLQAEGEQVIVKSRLLEWLEQYSDTK